MNWIKNNMKKSLFAIFFAYFFIWFLTRDIQEELPYRISGAELLKIKTDCKNLAESKKEEWNNSGIGSHTLADYGYSEFRGFCYAEFLQNYGELDSKLAYNTTEDKEIFRREWTKDINWYESDFDRIILGKHRIWDWRQPM